ncbi:hypothetical protein EV421DRAFT_1909875 [Armillaria borealis]|uniref:Uncharacterized protein n=1 Tax=Armillaria borealis TaxID=47425 RepID=A0AA39J3F3_9AGAR|nr:hypothetical protein EV421DRAFT_1909875 [Armillaria borealis]
MDGAIKALLSNPIKVAKLGDMAKDKGLAEFISEGLQLERQQRHLQLLVVKNKTYPNETNKETIKCKQLSLQKAIKILLAADQLCSMGYDKSKNVKGYKLNTKAQEKMRQVKLHRNSGMVDWNVHRAALIAMGTVNDSQLKGLPELKKEDIRQQAVDKNRAAAANIHKKKKTAKKRGKKGGKAMFTEEPEDEDDDDKDDDKTGWIYELNKHGNINTTDL